MSMMMSYWRQVWMMAFNRDSMKMEGKNMWRCMMFYPCKGLTVPSSTTTCSSLSTSCHLMPNPFIHSSVFTNHCLNSLQAVVKRWFKSSQCMESTHLQYNRGHCECVRSCQPIVWNREISVHGREGAFGLQLLRPTSVTCLKWTSPYLGTDC